MWIRGTLRLIVVALLGIEISIIALVSAASAASGGGTWQTPPPTVRAFDTEGTTGEGDWYTPMYLDELGFQPMDYRPRPVGPVGPMGSMGSVRSTGSRPR